MTKNSALKYFIYVRKSTEGEERQALSIDSQKDKALEVFGSLNIIEVLAERHSAFTPYNRPVFEAMIKRIKAGEANGIIAWHPDRLSRNEIDASTISYLVRTGVIHDLKFGSYNFDNSPEGIMMLQMALSQSQYFSSKLGKDVKRGLEKKVALGWLPGQAPEGYLNDMRLEKGQRTIIVDKNRFALLRMAFDLYLTGTFSATEVLTKLNYEWFYRTRLRKSKGNHWLSRSAWYKILNNPFYAGIIVYNGKEYPGKHKAMITLDEFNRVQELLGQHGCHKRPYKNDFAFAGLFSCGVCGCAITAEHKAKYNQSQQATKGYTYYHCTHKRKQANCHEASVEEIELNEQIKLNLSSLAMNEKLLAWALEYLDTQTGVDKENNQVVKASRETEIKTLNEHISTLTMMRARDLLDDNEYLEEKTKLKQEINRLEQQITETGNQNNLELIKEKFIFSAYAFRDYLEADKAGKREIVFNLGQNRNIINKNIAITPHKWLIPLYDNVAVFNAELAKLEPALSLANTTQKEAFASLRSRWLGDRDSNPNKQDQNLLSYR